MSFSERDRSASSPLVDGGFVVAMMAACLVVLVFRVQNIAYQFDELVSLAYSQESWGSLIGPNWSSDTHRPYYYIVQKIWNATFGTDRLAVRALNIALGVLCVPLIYVIARRLGGRDVARMSTVCFILMPMVVYQNREARMYPLLNLSILVATAALVVLFEVYSRTPSAPKDRPRLWLWAAFVLGAASAFYAHATGILFVPLCGAILVAGIAMRQLRAVVLRDFVIACILLTIICLPAVLPMIFHVRTTLSDFWIPASSMGWVYSQFVGAYPFPAWGKPIMLGLLCLGFWSARHSRMALILLVVFVVGQPLLVLGLSFLKPILIVRVIVWPTMFAAIVLGFAVASFGRYYRVAALAAVLAVQLVALRPFYPASTEYSDFDLLKDRFAEFEPAQDVLILGSQDFEYALRWNHPDLINAGVKAFNYGDRRQIFDAVNRTSYVNRADAQGLEPEGTRLWILSEVRPRFPIPPEDSVSDALSLVAAKGTLLDSLDVGALQLDRYQVNAKN